MKRCTRLLVFLVAALFGLVSAPLQAAAQPLVIGSTNFPEQLILAHVYADVLQARDVAVRLRLNLGAREVVFPALLAGEIDVLPEYTGSMLDYLTRGEQAVDSAITPEAVYAAAAKALPEELVMLEPAEAQDKDAFVVRRETAQRHDLETLSDLKGVAPELILGGPPELRTRRIGLPGFEEVYGVQFKNMRSLDAGGPLTTAALQDGSIDVGLFFTTQGIIAANDWLVLRDDRDLIAAENLVPVIRKAALTPEIRQALNTISAQLTTAALQQMNRAVIIDQRDPKEVAHEWAKQQGLLQASDAASTN